jgi:hypothetical protein
MSGAYLGEMAKKRDVRKESAYKPDLLQDSSH